MEFKLIGSNRKTVAIQVNPDLSITVRAPRYASKREIDRIVEKNETWIYKHIEIIKKNKTRWGSCSSKGNLNFNCLLMLALAEILDYVVVHELCHRKEMNHSKAFWAEVEKVLPDYRESVKWLKEKGIVR
jgi:hypothetical protein